MTGGFRPRLVPTLVMLPLVVLCLGLGIWQIQRLHWKEGLIAERRAAAEAPPAVAPPTLAAARALGLRRVTDRGTFLNDREILVHAIAPDGAAGFDVLTPLRETGGRVVFVDRGFVPSALKDRSRRAAGQPTGTVEVHGLLLLQPAAKPGWFLPNNAPASGEWFWIDLPAMIAASHLNNVAPFFIAADATPNPGGWPRGGDMLSPLPNHHLQYAITWFSLAVAGLVIYVVSQRGDDRADGSDDKRLPPA